MSSPESDVLRKHYGDLCAAIDNADFIAITLYSMGLISREIRQDIEDLPTRNAKNMKLLSAMERVISSDRDKFEDVLTVLHGEEYLQSLVEKMRVGHCKYMVVDLCMRVQ